MSRPQMKPTKPTTCFTIPSRKPPINPTTSNTAIIMSIGCIKEWK